MSDAEKPLVTFALFAFNQEKFIREAVEGAFAQTYEPLEIILSDDCSTDRTFDIMEEMAAAYRGSHQVLTRKTVANRGTLLHVAEVAALAHGELLILAAGDDVSKPFRANTLAASWKATGAWGLCSRFDRIDERGALLESSVASAVLDGHGFKRFFYEEEGPIKIVHGCTSAYDVRAFAYLRLQPEDFILAEDGAISVLLNLLGKRIVNLDESLAFYRESVGSLTNNRTKRRITLSGIAADERRIEWFTRAQANRCELFLRMNAYLGVDKARKLKLETVEAELKRLQYRADWRTTRFVERLCFVAIERQATWALPRLFGLKFFFLIKWLTRQFTWRRG
jgi:glycosyltransferase involved in cell wall biosynthesis